MCPWNKLMHAEGCPDQVEGEVNWLHLTGI